MSHLGPSSPASLSAEYRAWKRQNFRRTMGWKYCKRHCKKSHSNTSLSHTVLGMVCYVAIGDRDVIFAANITSAVSFPPKHIWEQTKIFAFPFLFRYLGKLEFPHHSQSSAFPFISHPFPWDHPPQSSLNDLSQRHFSGPIAIVYLNIRVSLDLESVEFGQEL